MSSPSLLTLPPEILQEILSLLILSPKQPFHPLDHRRQISSYTSYVTLRSTCKPFQNLVDTPSTISHYFPSDLELLGLSTTEGNETVSRHPANINRIGTYHRTSHRNIAKIPIEEWTDVERSGYLIFGDKPLQQLRGIVEGIRLNIMPVFNITSLFLNEVLSVPYPEWDTPHWQQFLSRLKIFYVFFLQFTKPTVPVRHTIYPDRTDNDVDRGMLDWCDNSKEDDYVAAERFEKFSQQVLTFPRYLRNVEQAGG